MSANINIKYPIPALGHSYSSSYTVEYEYAGSGAGKQPQHYVYHVYPCTRSGCNAERKVSQGLPDYCSAVITDQAPGVYVAYKCPDCGHRWSVYS